MDAEKKLDGTALVDGVQLRHELTALARATPDFTKLRQAGLGLIKTAFLDGREKVRLAVRQEGLPGLLAARALSDMQDVLIQVIYDFAVKHVYYAQNPASA